MERNDYGFPALYSPEHFRMEDLTVKLFRRGNYTGIHIRHDPTGLWVDGNGVSQWKVRHKLYRELDDKIAKGMGENGS